jgi:hypothetical protein
LNLIQTTLVAMRTDPAICKVIAFMKRSLLPYIYTAKQVMATVVSLTVPLPLYSVLTGLQRGLGELYSITNAVHLKWYVEYQAGFAVCLLDGVGLVYTVPSLGTAVSM